MRFVHFVLVATPLMPALLEGQSKNQANQTAEVGGMTLAHGMSRDTAQSRLMAAGFDPLDLGENDALSVVNKVTKETATLNFKDGKLIGVMKEWLTETPTAESMFNTLYDLVGKFEKDGNTLCSISAPATASPTNSNKSVLLACGETESIDVSISTFSYLKDRGPVFGITEEIFWEKPRLN